MGNVNYRNLAAINKGHADYQHRLVRVVTFAVNATAFGMILAVRLGGVNEAGIYAGLYIFLVILGIMAYRLLWLDYRQACRESHPPTERGERHLLPARDGGWIDKPASRVGGSK